MDASEYQPFPELPAALIEELLTHARALSRELEEGFSQIRAHRSHWRDDLFRAGVLSNISSLPLGVIPTTCGVDGSYAVERLLANDLAVAAALAIEGLTPPSEKRYWPDPHHRIWARIEPHESETGTLLRAIMMGMEISIAVNAPHDIIFLDGSLTTPFIYFNQALNKAKEAPHLQASSFLREHMVEFLEDYATILTSHRSDHLWLGVPKYTTRREIASYLNWQSNHDDRGLLSFILEPGEFTRPIPLQKPEQPWHLNTEVLLDQGKDSLIQLESRIIDALYNLHVVYYRPYAWMPALRIEVNRSVAENPHQLALALQAVHFQSGAPAIMEPYPLYMADRMVRHLPRAIPTVRQIASQYVAETYSGKIEEIFLGLHGYRSESGV
jgi:hypothetical protein